MRKAFVETLFRLQEVDSRAVVLLGDIGVFGFRKSFERFPDRTFNMGILEQSMVGIAAGFSRMGFIPFVHTIAPFLVERALEQLKIDFGYQGLRGNFVSVGASYDYAALGCTHHCPADISLLKSIPNFEIVVPGTSQEFTHLFMSSYASDSSTYYRLSETVNSQSQPVQFGKATLIQKGRRGLVVAVGPMLDRVLEATHGRDLSVLYYTTLSPFDSQAIRVHSASRKIFVVAPFYEGSLTADILKSLDGEPIAYGEAAVPRRFLTAYGDRSFHDEALGLDAKALSEKIENFFGKSPSVSVLGDLSL